MFVIHSLHCGGSERATTGLANFWAAAGKEVSILTNSECETDFYSVDQRVKRITLTGDLQNVPSSSGIVANIKRAVALRKIIKKVKPDICIGMMTHSAVLVAISRLGLTGKYIGSERVHPPKSPLGVYWEFLRSHAYKYLDCMVVLSKPTAEWMAKNTNAKNIEVIPNAVQWPLPLSTPVVEPSAKLKSERKIILSVGRFHHQKGFDLLLDAFGGIADEFPDWDLCILGDGPLLEQFQKQKHQLRIKNQIFYPGRVGNLTDWYTRADIFVLPSRFEGFPNALVEAMSYGLPVVSADCLTGPADLIHDDINGVLVAPEDVEALQAGLLKTMASVRLRARLGGNAKAVRTALSIERVSEEWMNLFQA